MNNLEQLAGTILDLVQEVPFGNSDTQNRVAIVNEECTPHRSYRHAALRIMNRIEALREVKFNLRKRDIEIRMLQRERDTADELRKEMIDLEIEHRRSGDRYSQKLISDAIREIESLWPVIQAMGRVSRADFEQGELAWYQKKHGIKLDLKSDLYSQIENDGQNTVAIPDLRKELLNGSG